MQERERTVDVLRRLKSQESKPTPSDFKKTERRVVEEPVKIVNFPQKKIEDMMKKITDIRNKIKTGNSNYFNLYYDLKSAEQDFVKEATILKEKNFQIPKTTMMRVDEMLNTFKRGDKK